MTKVAFLHTQLAGVVMYRIMNFAKYINKRKHGKAKMNDWEIDDQNINAWEHCLVDDKFDVCKDIYKLCDKADIIVMQKFINPAGLALIDGLRMAFPKKPICFEIDDYMFNVPSWNMAAGSFNPGGQLFMLGLKQIEKSNCIITSTNYLKKLYSEFSKNIFVAENCIDFEWWGKLENKNKKNKKIKIGWAGANAHKGDLEMIRPVIDRIVAKYGDKVEFEIFGPGSTMPLKEGETDIKGVKINTGFVKLSKYPDKLKSLGFDIGLAPLRDNYFNRAKSANRYLEFSMLGIPTVASNIGGQFNEVIKHGENGYLCSSVDEWVEAISKLIDDKEHRIKMGKLAFETVDRYFNADTYAKKYMDMIDTILKLPIEIQPIKLGENAMKELVG